jgi:hypothetical protein
MRLDYKITRSILKKEENDRKTTHSRKLKRSKKKGWLKMISNFWNKKEDKGNIAAEKKTSAEVNDGNGSVFSAEKSKAVNGSVSSDSSTPKEQGLSMPLIDSSDGTISNKHDVNEDANSDTTIRCIKLVYNVH